MPANREAIRQQIAKQYNSRIKELEKENRALKEKIQEESGRCAKLEETVRQQSDWIERLLELTGLSPDEVKARVAADHALNSIGAILASGMGRSALNVFDLLN